MRTAPEKSEPRLGRRERPNRGSWRIAARVIAIILGLALTLLLVLGVLLWSGNERILTAWGNFLRVEEESPDCDIIYILGGDYLTRAPHAAEMYRAKKAPKVVIPWEDMRSRDERQEHFSLATERILMERGVPKEAIHVWKFKEGVLSTADEIRALAAYVDVFPGTQRILLVTTQYHTRRARYAANRAMPWGVKVYASGVEDPNWKMDGWWYTRKGREAVAEEYWKLLYYVPRFLFG